MYIEQTLVTMPGNALITFGIEKPNICPICKQSGDHTAHSGLVNRTCRLLSLTLECTLCYELFFSKYLIVEERSAIGSPGVPAVTELLATYPAIKQENELPEEMEIFFPEFSKIYDQALAAQSAQLDLITGMAFRKSLEFLVKTYLIQKLPMEEERIRNEFLGASIKRIDYPLIQRLATAATWLGNDESHFTKKHLDYNVADIKRFILALCHLIVAEKVAEDAATLVD